MAAAKPESILRRNRPGCKASEFYDWPDEDIEQMESTLSVQQFIQQSIRRDTLDVDAMIMIPASQEEGVWKYEHLRQFCLELNDLTVLLQDECLPATCTKMMATDDWVFLCAAHKQPKECPAIDYTRHTLDGAAQLLNSNKYFPSRVTIKDSAVAKLGSICRRVYRIFAHAFFHHRHIFDQFEMETALCLRFTKFVKLYLLMTEDNLLVPQHQLETLVQQALAARLQSHPTTVAASAATAAAAAPADTAQHQDQPEPEEPEQQDSSQNANSGPDSLQNADAGDDSADVLATGDEDVAQV
eukprot:scpid84765/ scgid26429/ MOB-like protein phocein; Mob1 homolog 3; Mps one binder kinase activator-like 3; Preimplantation protein 3